MKAHFLSLNLPLRKMFAPSLGYLILLTTVIFLGTSERQGWPRSTWAELCDHLPLSPGRVLILYSPECCCREAAAMFPITSKNFIREQSPKVFGFLHPCSQCRDLMLGAWERYFCLWVHDLVAVGLEQIVSTWTHTNSGRSWRTSVCHLIAIYVTPPWKETLARS